VYHLCALGVFPTPATTRLTLYKQGLCHMVIHSISMRFQKSYKKIAFPCEIFAHTMTGTVRAALARARIRFPLAQK